MNLNLQLQGLVEIPGWADTLSDPCNNLCATHLSPILCLNVANAVSHCTLQCLSFAYCPSEVNTLGKSWSGQAIRWHWEVSWNVEELFICLCFLSVINSLLPVLQLKNHLSWCSVYRDYLLHWLNDDVIFLSLFGVFHTQVSEKEHHQLVNQSERSVVHSDNSGDGSGGGSGGSGGSGCDSGDGRTAAATVAKTEAALHAWSEWLTPDPSVS